jgi:hypothetical protein
MPNWCEGTLQISLYERQPYSHCWRGKYEEEISVAKSSRS